MEWPKEPISFLACKYQQIAKSCFKEDIFCISLADSRLMDVTQLALTWFGWPNGEKLAHKSDLDQSMQVIASACKDWPNGVANRPKFSNCIYLRFCFARALISEVGEQVNKFLQ